MEGLLCRSCQSWKVGTVLHDSYVVSPTIFILLSTTRGRLYNKSHNNNSPAPRPSSGASGTTRGDGTPEAAGVDGGTRDDGTGAATPAGTRTDIRGKSRTEETENSTVHLRKKRSIIAC